MTVIHPTKEPCSIQNLLHRKDNSVAVFGTVFRLLTLFYHYLLIYIFFKSIVFLNGDIFFEDHFFRTLISRVLSVP